MEGSGFGGSSTVTRCGGLRRCQPDLVDFPAGLAATGFAASGSDEADFAGSGLEGSRLDGSDLSDSDLPWTASDEMEDCSALMGRR